MRTFLAQLTPACCRAQETLEQRLQEATERIAAMTVDAQEREARLATLDDLVAGVQTLMRAAGVLQAPEAAAGDAAEGGEADGDKSYSIESDGEY